MKPEEALALLKKYGASGSVLEHVKVVRDYAMEMAENADCDRELVEAGALLHDIGRTETHGIDHAVVGAKILRKEGVDERIVRIVERHIGAGITREDAEYLGLPPADYLPETIEEKIVCHADNLIGKKDRVTIREAIETARERWSPGAVDRLIQYHFEVFKPVEIAIDNRTPSAQFNPKKKQAGTLKKEIDETIAKMDVLYKLREEDGDTIVSLYGSEAEKAAKRLKKKLLA